MRAVRRLPPGRLGSALSDEFRSGKSDLDLLVELGPMDPHDRIDADIECTKQVVYAA